MSTFCAGFLNPSLRGFNSQQLCFRIFWELPIKSSKNTLGTCASEHYTYFWINSTMYPWELHTPSSSSFGILFIQIAAICWPNCLQQSLSQLWRYRIFFLREAYCDPYVNSCRLDPNWDSPLPSLRTPAMAAVVSMTVEKNSLDSLAPSRWWLQQLPGPFIMCICWVQGVNR